MAKPTFSARFYRAARKYRRLQLRLTQPLDISDARRLNGKLNHLKKRLTTMNRRWRLGVAASVLSAWLAAPAWGQGVIDLDSLDGSNGFTLNNMGGEYVGRSVSGAGDVNGDGFDDLIIGAPNANPAGVYVYDGRSYVVFGQAEGFPTAFDLSTLDGTNGFALNGSNGEAAGSSVSGAGDVNGDGFDDVIIGAPYAVLAGNSSYDGRSYVVFGAASGFPATLDLSALNGTDGFAMNGSLGEEAGRSVSGAGDVNGDGFDDLLVGAPYANPTNSYTYTGRSYVIFGAASEFPAVLNLSLLDGDNGFAAEGGDLDESAGSFVSSVGDMNNDGFDDFIVASPYTSTNGGYEGRSYVVFGRSSGFSALTELDQLDGTDGFAIDGSDDDTYSGFSASGAGDVNGDGFDDVIVSVASFQGAGTRSVVVFGRVDAFPATLDLGTLDSTDGFSIVAPDHYLGAASGIGDINGDGIEDVLFGTSATSESSDYGAGYVVFGRADGFSASLDVGTLDGTNGFTASGALPNEGLGISVDGAGDLNGDGVDDLLIGAPYGSVAGTNSGRVYVIFGAVDITSLPSAQPAAAKLYPNPTAGATTLQLPAPAHDLALYDATGRQQPLRYEALGVGRYALDLSALPPGLYLLRGTAGGAAFARRLVRE